ncbi:MAG: hypothetical protein AAF316_00265 [Cyanobacteria bacterium P01_A01_bin.80]
MAINPTLLTSGGTQVQISVLNYGETIPTPITITVTSEATAGDTSLDVTFSPTTSTIYAGLAIKVGTAPNEQWVLVSQTVQGTATSLPVEPITATIAANSTGTTYAALPLIGLEGANMELSTEENSVVLLANGGWTVRDYSTGSFSFSGNLYLPTTPEFAIGARQVADALIAKQNVYLERVLPDGTYHAGLCMVQSASDTTQGAQYVTQNVNFAGSGTPVQIRLNAAA